MKTNVAKSKPVFKTLVARITWVSVQLSKLFTCWILKLAVKVNDAS